MRVTGGAWSAAEDARLRQLWAEGLSTAVIGDHMGRGKNSIIGRVHRLRLPGRANPVGQVATLRNPWQPEEDARLRQMVLRGDTRAEMAAALGRPQESVRSRLRALRLTVSRRAAREKIQVLRARAARIACMREAHAATAATIPAQAGDPTAAVPAARGCEAAGVSSLTSPPAEAFAPRPAALLGGRAPAGCCWPMWGDRERPTHRYCGAARSMRADGALHAYCDEHRARARGKGDAHDDADPPHRVTRSTFAWGGQAA